MKGSIFLFHIFSFSIWATAQVPPKNAASPQNIITHNKNQISIESNNSLVSKSADEQTVSDYFQKGNCGAIRDYFKDKDLTLVTPLHLAILAYCEPPEKDAEKMFKFAEKSEPDNDTILLLHARYRWKKYMLTANELWQKLAKQAKDERIHELALEYLGGHNQNEDQNIIPELFSGITVLTQVGSVWESNPLGAPDSDTADTKSNSYGITSLFGIQNKKETFFGFMAGSLLINNTSYLQKHEADTGSLDAVGTIGLQSAEKRFLLLQQFDSVTTLAGLFLYSVVGVGVGELWLGDNSDFQVLLSAFQDRYLQNIYQAQEGTHYKADIKSTRKYSDTLSLTAEVSWEHVSAGEDDAVNEVIPYSASLWGGNLSIQQSTKSFLFGLNCTLLDREDDLNSLFTDSTGTFVSRRRKDLSFQLQPWIAWKISTPLSLLMFYNRLQTASNMGALDAIDRNIHDQIFGFTVKAAF